MDCRNQIYPEWTAQIYERDAADTSYHLAALSLLVYYLSLYYKVQKHVGDKEGSKDHVNSLEALYVVKVWYCQEVQVEKEAQHVAHGHQRSPDLQFERGLRNDDVEGDEQGAPVDLGLNLHLHLLRLFLYFQLK